MVSVLLRYQELALKGKNRPWFQRHLIRHLRRALTGLGVREVRVPMGRIEVVVGRDSAVAEVRERLRYVFGIANFSVATRVSLDVDAIGDGILRDLPIGDPSSFRVRVRRADKRFPVRSPEIERVIGGRIAAARGWSVNLRDPGLTIGVEIVPGEAFYHFGKEPGAGGLPTGTGGRVVALLSGGIDSPVAAWRMMRRGCTATFVHFHSYPFLSRASQDKARELAAFLTRFQLSSRLQLVPIGEIQRQVTLAVPSALRVIVYRRLMFRVATRIAARVGAHGLVTGDAVGQVASQTLENMAVTGAAVPLPVFRPLIGMDKDEITAAAQRLGTYPVSIVPDEDCCTLFTPRHPVTRARLDEIESAERGLPIEEFTEQAIRQSVVERFECPAIVSGPPPRPGS
ncbi:MAG TPA: tRNA uracil 4-sulfurtransferase ThiI [Vicinamibacterales bacterium]|jgi:thiamine biosynthesis protein ThiI|nr:tRNA uracil 4-sulfurtransferase ThiI [Vicinamibacterales bacterium]